MQRLPPPLKRRDDGERHLSDSSFTPFIQTVSVDEQDTVPSSQFRSFCRALGLSLFYHKLFHRARGNAPPEPTKVAIYGDRTRAMLSSLIHFVPVGVAVSISSLNLSGYYIGGELAGATGQDQEKLAGLQFAAKLHELTITASLAAILFFYIRHEIVLETGVPFGAAFAGLQFQNVSFFWSQEFWGTPRQGTWSAGGTKFFINTSTTDLWPTMLDGSQVPDSCSVDTGDPSCPSGDWQTLSQDYLTYFPGLGINAGTLPETTRIASRKSVREIYTRSRIHSLYVNYITVATTQTSVIADAVSETGRLWAIAAKNIEGSQWRFQYRLAAYYNETPREGFNNSSNYLLFYNLSDIGTFRSKGEFPVEPYINDTALEMVQLARESSVPQLLWFALPQADYGNATIGAAVTYPQSSTNQSLVVYCTVDARWASVVMQGFRNEIKVVAGGPFNDAWPKINIAPDWATFLNAEIPYDNSNVFLKMLEAAGSWNSTNPIASAEIWAVIESILAVMIANGLGRLSWKNSLVGYLVDGDQEWMRQMMPQTSSMGPGGTAFVEPPTSSGPTSNFTMTAQVSGWAYSAEGTATKVYICWYDP
ncbi:MAG: hypothetical protein FRX48_05463 [Lasallia pustulata]|uniref:Uncharacterized protein n=1 Tax=Lasallia pustulata TaxID=136370 RepID=A0A5M8PNP5_9LECA|nr:MAG: hypothetical protein FRX48_05463 [Lasallia pustulata]